MRSHADLVSCRTFDASVAANDVRVDTDDRSSGCTDLVMHWSSRCRRSSTVVTLRMNHLYFSLYQYLSHRLCSNQSVAEIRPDATTECLSCLLGHQYKCNRRCYCQWARLGSSQDEWMPSPKCTWFYRLVRRRKWNRRAFAVNSSRALWFVAREDSATVRSIPKLRLSLRKKRRKKKNDRISSSGQSKWMKIGAAATRETQSNLSRSTTSFILCAKCFHTRRSHSATSH